MKKRFLTSIITIIVLLLPLNVYASNNSENNQSEVIIKYKKEDQKAIDNIPKIGCEAVYIAEPNTGKVIYEKNAHKKMYPASTTKILTALVVMEKCQLTDKVVVSKNAISLVPEGASNVKLKVGEELTISDLLYDLLIPSANEAANVLAEHVSGSIEAFAELCNSRAKELGCETLHFVNPNGLHNDNHYCSAYDLYLIAKECKKHDIFNEIVKTKSFKLPATNVYTANDRTFTNTNELLLSGKYHYEYCTGIKTGHTTPAGECLVASSSYNNMDLISVVLGGKAINSLGLNERFYDTKQLFEFTYKNYSMKEIVADKSLVATLDVGKATMGTKSLDANTETSVKTILPNNINIEDVKASININENLTAPIKQDQVIGKITYYADGLECTTNIIASHEVKKLPYYLYNIIVVVAVILTIIIISKVIKKSRKKILILFLGLTIIIAEGVAIYFIMQEGKKNSVTQITPVSSNISYSTSASK